MGPRDPGSNPGGPTKPRSSTSPLRTNIGEEPVTRNNRKKRRIRFLGTSWDIPSFIVFWLGIVGFTIGILIIILFTPLEYDLIGVVISIASLMTSFMTASRKQIEELGARLESRLEDMGNKLDSIIVLLQDIREQLSSRRRPEE